MPSQQLVYPYFTGTTIEGSGFNTTCTVTNGSATVTGQFTIWETAIDKGDVLFVGGNMGLVLEVVSDTELTLANPWAGASADATAYAVYRNNSYVDPRNYGRRLAEYLPKLRALPANIDEMMEIATEAVAARDKAEEWATKTDAEVEPGEGYGAKKYAQDAAGSANTATAAATTATEEATEATGAATVATGALADFRNIYYGDLPADPTTKPSGAPPEDGDFYYNTTTGGLRLRKGGLWVNAVIDANGSLIAANNLSDLTDKAVARGNLGLGTGPLAGFRNKIINGNFDIWQRATSQTISGYGSDDRWNNSNGGSTKTHSLQTFTLGQTDVPGNPRYFSRTVVSSVVGASNFVSKYQGIEGVGTLAGKTATMSFYAKADAPRNMAIEFTQIFGAGGSPSPVNSFYSQKVALTTAWQRFDIHLSVPSLSGKSLGTNNNDGLFVTFWFDAGSSFDSRTVSLGQQSGTFDIARVSLVEGNAVGEDDPFSARHIQQETALCQRYAELLSAKYWGNASTVGVTLGDSYPFKVLKRASPTLTAVSQAYVNCSILSLEPTGDRVGVAVQSGAAGAVVFNMTVLAAAEL
jgi:hypothetical protein